MEVAGGCNPSQSKMGLTAAGFEKPLIPKNEEQLRYG
jgi:hypothetical protein